MAATVRSTIKDITYNHLKSLNSLCFGQCLTAVGWVGGTLPELYEEDGMVELTTADVANGGFVVGAGLSGIKPIYVVRYQGFQWLNSPIITNYAAKSKEIWGISCPIFIRSIAMEGGVGPVAGSSHHSLYFRMPGVKIISPMTPKEYEFAYNDFMDGDDVMYVSEHRGSYDNSDELPDYISNEMDIILFPISICRFEAIKAKQILESKGIKTGIINLLWLKPFIINEDWIKALKTSHYGGIIIDDDYQDGIARSIAHRLMIEAKKDIFTLGLEDKTAGFHKNFDNLPPSSNKIVEMVKKIITLKKNK